MSILARLLPIVILLQLCLPIELLADSSTLAERVLVSSQLIENLEHFANAYESVANQSIMTKDDCGLQSKVLLALKDSFDIRIIRKKLLETLMNEFDEAHLRKLADFLEQPVVSRMRREEWRIEEPESREELCRYTAEITGNPLPAERIELVRRIETARRCADDEAATIIVLAESMNKSLEPLLPPEEHDRRVREINMLKENQDVLKRDSRRELMLNLYFIYRNADDATLRQYLELLSTEEGKAFVSFTLRAVPMALAETEKLAVSRIAEILQELRSCREP